MANQLYTTQFMRVCIANLLLFVSLYMLLPVIPLEMSQKLGLSIADTGKLFLVLTAGMFVVGPFSAYMVDAYKRKYVCVLSSLGMVGATVGYYFVDSYSMLLALSGVQGVFVGMATTSGVTLAIDITHTTKRSFGNLAFSWMLRMGMLSGVALGVWLYQWYSFEVFLIISVAAGLIGMMCLSTIYVPFRAPIVTSLCSTDRFLLLRGWIPAINIAIIALVPGLFIPIFHHYNCGLTVFGLELPFFAFVAVGFSLALICYSQLFKTERFLSGISVGLALILISTLLPYIMSPLLLGFGLGIVAPLFLLLFVKFSYHCQRGTANTTHFLAWSIGISSGIAWSCELQSSNQYDSIYYYATLSSLVAFVFFLLITYPYFKSKRVR